MFISYKKKRELKPSDKFEGFFITQNQEVMMPLPKPSSNETEDEFLNRCMSDSVMTAEYADNDQRYAICNQLWEGRKMSNNLERKSISIDLKDETEGSFVARIATLNVRDKDNDITKPGAFENGKTVLVSAYMHGSWMGKLPIGKATIKEDGEEVIAEGQFNLKTSEGRDTYEAVKFAPNLQEWSYGFYPVEANDGEGEEKGARILRKVEVKEISPVLVGAGVNTGVLAIKNKDEGMTYADQASAVLAAVEDLVDRTKSLADLRLKEGRVLSTQNRDRMKKLLTSLSEVAADLKKLLDATEPKDDKALLQAVLLFTKIKQELSEVM